jgi:hypothetical protein
VVRCVLRKGGMDALECFRRGWAREMLAAGGKSLAARLKAALPQGKRPAPARCWAGGGMLEWASAWRQANKGDAGVHTGVRMLVCVQHATVVYPHSHSARAPLSCRGETALGRREPGTWPGRWRR